MTAVYVKKKEKTLKDLRGKPTHVVRACRALRSSCMYEVVDHLHGRERGGESARGFRPIRGNATLPKMPLGAAANNMLPQRRI